MADGLRQSRSRLGGATGAKNPALEGATRSLPDPATLLEGIRSGDRALLGQAISLVESTRQEDRRAAAKLLDQCSGDSVRVAISGSPGVGKSTLIDALGMHIVEAGHRVAVLAVDPTSTRSGGSILGDKTRMPRLAASEAAFIRPSPSGGMPGGVGRQTRPAITICEAAGFDLVILETVGVGQSETAARDMADFFLLLSLAGAGDELQGIKRGIVEVADAIAITKADGQNQENAHQAATRVRSALRLFPTTESGWKPPVLTCSAVSGSGLDAIWDAVKTYQARTRESGWFHRQRAEQRESWFKAEVDALRLEQLKESDLKRRRALEDDVRAGRQHPYSAALKLVFGE